MKEGTMIRFILAVAQAASVDPKTVAWLMRDNNTKAYASQVHEALKYD